MDVKKQTIDLAKVDRDSFLRKTLSAYIPSLEVDFLLDQECIAKFLDAEILKKISDSVVRNRCLMVGSISLSTSISGSLGTLALIPVDCAQFAYHAVKLSQELYYIYGKRNMFTCQGKEDMDMLLYLLLGAGSAVTITTSTLSALGQKLYQKALWKLHLRSLSFLPFVGCAIHGGMSAYAMYSLALEYIERLQDMVEEQIDATPKEVAKQIGEFIDVEYREAEEKIRSFCNLAKLREYYQYLEAGYLSKEEFEQLKLDL